MYRCSTKELRKLEIINLCDGARLGYACDFTFDRDSATVLSLIIPGKSGFFGIGREDDLVIPWCKIQCFGEDTILVKLSQTELEGCYCACEDKNRRYFRHKC